MVSIALFYDNPNSYGMEGTSSIIFDLLLSESHNFGASITDYALEDGSIISDSITNELENGSFSGLFTNFSINTTSYRSNRAQHSFDALYDLWQRKELVTIFTIHKKYENMAITSISISRDDGTGEALEVSISFRKVNIVKLQEIKLDIDVNLKNLKSKLNKQSAKNIDLGKTVTK